MYSLRVTLLEQNKISHWSPWWSPLVIITLFYSRSPVASYKPRDELETVIAIEFCLSKYAMRESSCHTPAEISAN